jgi:hypothetical protein
VADDDRDVLHARGVQRIEHPREDRAPADGKSDFCV